ncbi:SARP family transcriptional regulator [Spongiactinospora rosea]|uniref:SARP family transcriptional regulator n=1 Tax=Spongiactinospora rosea TaxID=2248750 RepID=A0A366M3Z5_9ACTN|nr:BTAD domain-containing putative transcriptional regulator [Spongiactinospora rosea]RBQ20915.1 SARP family transcriptional regulator [Spongiactinospora rosea]
MTLRLLGPLELITQGRSLNPGGFRQQVILAVLGLNVGKVTTVDQLIRAVWDEDAPPSARGQIQVCMSNIRKLFAEAGLPGAIRTLSAGYCLQLDEEHVDTLQFDAKLDLARRQTETGDPAEAVGTLRVALALWRGPALAGLDSGLVRRAAAALDEKRTSAIEDLIRLQLKLGLHEGLTAELGPLVAEYALREKLHGYLMLALYRSGRQAEALEAYQRARAILIEEIGVEPGQELQTLHQAILTRDPSLDLPQPARPEPIETPAQPEAAKDFQVWASPWQLPASIADFTGRAGQIAEIKELLTGGPGAQAAHYAVPIVAISGRGGVGKSSLAIRVAHELYQEFPDGALYAQLEGPVSGERTYRQLARFLRALGVAGSAIPESLEERVELYRSTLAARRVLVLLDDALNEEQVRPLLPGSSTCAVIITSRHGLTGLPGAYHIGIDAFAPDESVEMLTKILGVKRVTAEEGAVTELYQMCDGLPLALRIAGARLASRRTWRIGRLVERLRNEVRRLDELEHRGWELRSSIGMTYHSLDEAAKRLVRLLALIQAPDVPSWTASALLDIDLMRAEDVLERLVDAHVLESVDYRNARVLRYRFHDLVRVYAREKLAETDGGEARAKALERVLGMWLALAEEAHRQEYGGDFTIIHGRAARWRPPDAEPADLMGSPMDWWDSERAALVAAVRQAADAGLDELAWELALTCVTLFEAKAYFDDWYVVTRAALDAVLRAGNVTGIAAMTYSMGTLHMSQGRLAEAEKNFRTALELFESVGNDHGYALVLRNYANVDGLRGDKEQMIAKYDRALDLLERVGDRIGAAHVMRTRAKHWLPLGETDRAQKLLEEALRICHEQGCVRVEAQVLHTYAELHVMTGELEQARHELDRVLRVVRDSGDRLGEAHALYGLGMVRLREGRLDSAETTMAHAIELARNMRERLIEGKALYSLGEISLARGNVAQANRHIVAARRTFLELGSTVWAAKAALLLSDSYVTGGELTLARLELNDAIDFLTADGSPEARGMLTEVSKVKSVLPVDG